MTRCLISTLSLALLVSGCNQTTGSSSTGPDLSDAVASDAAGGWDASDVALAEPEPDLSDAVTEGVTLADVVDGLDSTPVEDAAGPADVSADGDVLKDVTAPADSSDGPDTGTEAKDVSGDGPGPSLDATPDAQADGAQDVSPPAVPGACCEVHSGQGCEQVACSAAVCALDPFCCDTKWDSFCVSCAQGLYSFSGESCAGLQAVCGCELPQPEPVSHFELAEHWAPVWYHDTDDTHYEADYIVAYDFDGDTISSNNWENLDEPFVDLSAVIYYAIIETASHWFIYYLDFHPRDWTEDCDPLLWFVEPCHENDLEGAMVVIRKNGTNFGVFEVLYTEAHNTLHVATNDPNITAASTPNLEDVPVTFEGGSHVELYVESKGHGVCPLYYDGDSHCEHPTEGNPPAFPGGDGIVYRYDDGVAEQPSSGSDPNVSYKLVSFYDTMWKRRYDVCDGDCTYDQLMTYGGAQLGETFDGDTWGADKARPPWSWDDPDDGPVYSGDWFFDPAKTLVTHLSVPGEVSFDYVHNPYLDELWPAGGP